MRRVRTIRLIGKNLIAMDENEVEHDLLRLINRAPPAQRYALAGMSLRAGDCFWLGERYFEVRSS